MLNPLGVHGLIGRAPQWTFAIQLLEVVINGSTRMYGVLGSLLLYGEDVIRLCQDTK